MVSRGLALRLKPDAYPEYKRRHDELWPDMQEMLNELQLGMVIYRHGDTLFVHQTAPTEEHFDRAVQAAITPKWNAHMAEVLESGADGNLQFEALPLAFAWGLFAQ